jgi:AAA family ATP:ADP antiporter
MESAPRSPGPRTAVVAAMLAAGALIAQQVAGRATRDALFLSTFHVTSLPLVMIAAAVVSAAAVLGFSAALSRRSPAQVVPIAIAAGTVLLLAEWGLSLTQPRLAAIAVYLHMAAFGATVVSGFWSLMNERFDPHTARRVMGDVTLGASLGGVAGGMLTWAVSGLVPVPTMLAVMAAFNVACLLALSRLGPGDTGRGVTGERRTSRGEPMGALSGLRVMQEVPYLRDLALVVALGAATETLLDYILSARATATFAAGAPLMSFFALFHTAIGWLGLAVQMSLARPALRRLGLAGTVALRPAAVALAALAGLASPGLWTAVVSRGAHGVLNNSLFRSGYELLFTPVAERRKRPTKAIVDVGFDRLGTVVGGVLILGLASTLGALNGRVLFALAAAFALAAVAVSRRLHNGYVAALEDSLRSGVVRLDLADVVDSTTSMTMTRTGLIGDREAILREIAARRSETQSLSTRRTEEDPVAQAVAELRSAEPDLVRRGLRRPEAAQTALVGHIIPLLARNDLFLDALRALRKSATETTGQLLDALLDPRQDVAVRRRIPRVLRRTSTQRAADGLLLGLGDTQFGVRRQCALTLARITEREPRIAVPRAAVFAATLRELQAARDWGEEEADAGSTEESNPEVRPQSPAERGLAHVFTLLSLAVEREPLQIAYWAVLGTDPNLRGTALEYLENVLPDDVRRALWPHLGARPQAPPATRSRQKLEQDLLRSSETLGLSRQALKKLVPPR